MPPITLPHTAARANQRGGSSLGWRPWGALAINASDSADSEFVSDLGSDSELAGAAGRNPTLASARVARALQQVMGNTQGAPRPPSLNYSDSPRIKNNGGRRTVCVSDWTPFVFCRSRDHEV